MTTDTPTTGELYPAALREALTATAWDVLSNAYANGTLLDELAELTDIAERNGRDEAQKEAWAQGYRHGYNHGLKDATEAADPDTDGDTP